MTETGTSTTIDLSGLFETAFSVDPVTTETTDADVTDATQAATQAVQDALEGIFDGDAGKDEESDNTDGDDEDEDDEAEGDEDEDDEDEDDEDEDDEDEEDEDDEEVEADQDETKSSKSADDAEWYQLDGGFGSLEFDVPDTKSSGSADDILINQEFGFGELRPVEGNDTQSTGGDAKADSGFGNLDDLLKDAGDWAAAWEGADATLSGDAFVQPLALQADAPDATEAVPDATEAAADDTVSVDQFFDTLDDIVAEDSADTTGGVAWEMIWTSDWCYYTVTDGLVSETVCIEEPTQAEGEGDATWDMDMADEAGSDGGFRVPEIVITTGDEAEIEQWEAEREEEYMSIEQAWEDAVREVVNAIQEPVNKFIDQAGRIDEQTAWANLQTEEDVVTYLTNNIVVDGLTLNEMFGETIAQSYDAERQWLEENAWWVFDYSAYHIPPMMKKKSLAKRKMQAEKRLGKSLKVPMVKRTVPADDVPADDDIAASQSVDLTDLDKALEEALAALEQSVTTDEKCDSWEECNDEGVCWTEEKCWYDDDDDDWQEKAGDWLMDRVISYGFDPDVAEEWLESKQETWAEIEARQREEKANQLAQDVSELADEATKIFENMLDDLTSRFPDLTDMLSDELSGLAEDALDEISRAQNQTQSMIEDFVMDMSSNDIELKQIGETQAATNNGAYGYAALALGAAAVIAYSIKRRGSNKTSGINEPLIDDQFSRA